MKICTYNILEGGLGRIDPLAEVLRLSNADILCLQETWDEPSFHKLADRLHMDRFLAPNPRTAEGSVGILSRWSIRDAVNWAPLEPTLTRSALAATLTHGPHSLTVVCLHLHAREDVTDEATRLKEIEVIVQRARHLPEDHLLCGDFNTTHPLQPIEVAKLRPKVRDRVLARGWTGQDMPRAVIGRLLNHGYVDSHTTGRTPDAYGQTLSTSHPAMRTDYILATPSLAPKITSCDVFAPEMARFASDHYPVVADLAL